MNTHRVAGHPVEELLSALTDQMLTPEEEVLLSRHTETCAECRQRRARYNALREAIRGLSPSAGTQNLREEMWAAIAHERLLPQRSLGLLGRLAFAASVLLAAALVSTILVARSQVGGPTTPVREVVLSATFDVPGGTATLAIEHGSALAGHGMRTGTGARAELRIAQPATRGWAEIRFRRQGDPSYGVLGAAPDFAGANRLTFGGVVPRPAGSDAVTYEIWLHVESDAGAGDSPPLVVDVTATREGEDVRPH